MTTTGDDSHANTRSNTRTHQHACPTKTGTNVAQNTSIRPQQRPHTHTHTQFATKMPWNKNTLPSRTSAPRFYECFLSVTLLKYKVLHARRRRRRRFLQPKNHTYPQHRTLASAAADVATGYQAVQTSRRKVLRIRTQTNPHIAHCSSPVSMLDVDVCVRSQGPRMFILMVDVFTHDTHINIYDTGLFLLLSVRNTQKCCGHGRRRCVARTD